MPRRQTVPTVSCTNRPKSTFFGYCCLTFWRWSVAATLLFTEIIKALVKRCRTVCCTWCCVKPLRLYRGPSVQKARFLTIFTCCFTFWRWSVAATLLSTELIQALVKLYRMVHDTCQSVQPCGRCPANMVQKTRFLNSDAGSVREWPPHLPNGPTKRCPNLFLSNGVSHIVIRQGVKNPERIETCPFWAMPVGPRSTCHMTLRVW